MRWFHVNEVPLYRSCFTRYTNLRSLWETTTTHSYRVTSLIRNTPPVGPDPAVAVCLGPMVVLGGGVFLMSEVPLYFARFTKLLSWLCNHSPSTGPLASPDGAASAPLSTQDRVYAVELS